MSGSVPPALKDYSDRPANYASVTRGREQLFRRRVAELAKLSASKGLTGPLRLLDVGASAGTLVREAQRRGWEAVGIEPSAGGTGAASEQNINVVRGVAEDLPFGDETFDLVHSHHVFEHLADPGKATREVFRVLRPGGFLFIEVPNQFDNIAFRRDMLLNRISRRERNLRSIHHLWFFSRRTLRSMFEQAGFKNVNVFDTYGPKAKGWHVPAAILTRMAGRVLYGGPLLRAVGWKG